VGPREQDSVLDSEHAAHLCNRASAYYCDSYPRRVARQRAQHFADAT
jgi:hypothetical protein